MHAYTYSVLLICNHKYIYACMDTYMHACIHTYIHTGMHVPHIHTYTPTYIYTFNVIHDNMSFIHRIPY